MKIKRLVSVYSIVTDKFKQELQEGTTFELKMIDEQMAAIHNQIKQLQSRFGLLQNQSTQQAQEQINRSIMDLSDRLEHMRALKQGIMATMNEMQNKPNGSEVKTSIIENYIEINPGDNLKDIMERAKIVLKDGIVQEIVE